ncbi:MAG: substrate-binding periplasmic protein [Aestuariibacter sp.]
MLSASYAQTLQVMTESHPPVQYLEDDEIKGFATDIVRALLSKAQMQGEFHLVPWARAYDKAQHQPNTLIYSIARTSNREEKFHWIGPVSRLNVAVIGLTDRDFSSVRVLQDTQKYLFAVIRGAYSYDYLTQKGFSTNSNLFLAATMQEQVNLILNRKVDFLLTDPVVVRQRLNNLGFSGDLIAEVLWIPELSKDLYLAASLKTDIRIVNTLKTELQEMQPSAFYQARFNLKSH